MHTQLTIPVNFEDMFDHIPDYCCDAPTDMEVWLRLWQGKRLYLGTQVDVWDSEQHIILT